jgi:hypothetical protein
MPGGSAHTEGDTPSDKFASNWRAQAMKWSTWLPLSSADLDSLDGRYKRTRPDIR